MSNVPIINEELEAREIKCPVHGYIPVSKFITTVIDTPQFQRLRYLKQLGTSYYVWPGATHNRFEHALGVYHLSSLMVRRLQRSQPDLGITERDIQCVEVAGLCHDLGHGPFSHVWDNIYIPTAIPGCAWKHEDASEMMLDYLVQDNNIDLKPDEVRFIKDLIYGAKRHSAHHSPPEKGFLFEIVANKRNGIDVDKFDYIARDTRAVTDGSSTDLKRLVNTARVIHGEICYSEKNSMVVYSLFQDRYNLHKMIYNHKTAKSIEYMIVDALLKADPFMKISGRIYDPKKFMFLTDDILQEVERSDSPELAESRHIIRRIRNRDLYKLVDKMFLPWEFKKTWVEQYTPARILETAKSLSLSAVGENPDVDGVGAEEEIKGLIKELKEEHVIVDVTVLHHGMGDKFPLDNCKFYGKYDPDNAYPPRREADISHLLPDNFGELLIRVFARDSRYFGVIQHAARALQLRMDQPPPKHQHQHLQQPLQRQRSSTPEVPKTPPHNLSTQLSDGSLFESTGSTAVVEVPCTPAPLNTRTPTTHKSHPSTTPPTQLHNNYMTVPIGFTPKTPNLARSRGPVMGDEDETTPKMQMKTKGLLGAAIDDSSVLMKKKKREVDDVDDDGDVDGKGDKASVSKRQKA